MPIVEVKSNDDYTNAEILEWIEETLDAIARDGLGLLHGKLECTDDSLEAMADVAHTALELVYVLKERL